MYTAEAQFLSPADRLRHLNHDIKNHLFVVGMGLKTLEAIRHDPDQFREVLETIESEGLEPLKRSLQELMESAREGNSG